MKFMHANISGRQAIRTRYLPPTYNRGARISARAEAGSVIVPWDYALDVGDNHACAVLRLQSKLGWSETFSGGQFGSDFYWVSEATS